MSWTDKQKQMAVRGCAQVGIDEDTRKFLLRQFPRSMFDRDGKPACGPSSTSKRLNQSDFEQFMALIEDKAQGKRLLNFSAEYWSQKAGDDLHRMRRLARQISSQIATRVETWSDASLAGWVRNCIPDCKNKTLDQLDYHELAILIAQLRAYALKHGVNFKEAA